MQKSVALDGGKRPFGPVVWMMTISGFAANFASLSEKPLSFCTDFAHYHPIIWCWRLMMRATRVTAQWCEQQVRWKVKAVRRYGAETSCHAWDRHPKSWCSGR